MTPTPAMHLEGKSQPGWFGLTMQSAGGSAPVMAITNGPNNTVSMTYRRTKGIAGVSAAVQASGDLSTSNSWGTNGVQESVTDKGDYEEVTATVTNPPGVGGTSTPTTANHRRVTDGRGPSHSSIRSTRSMPG